ncbi:hypothetical protein COCNU_scaffold002401G000010 [Cocos nucifera]|nr:hypothetical protein [Cocos nucifera]
MASGATCVQRLGGSWDSAILTRYRISLRSSSMREPRYPLPRVVRCKAAVRGGAPPGPPDTRTGTDGRAGGGGSPASSLLLLGYLRAGFGLPAACRPPCRTPWSHLRTQWGGGPGLEASASGGGARAMRWVGRAFPPWCNALTGSRVFLL